MTEIYLSIVSGFAAWNYAQIYLRHSDFSSLFWTLFSLLFGTLVSYLGPNTFYDDLKNTMSEQADLNRKEFDDMDDDMRVHYEGFRAGMYVRMEVGWI